MAFKTTIKVALLTGAAKDDSFTTEATGLSEDMLQAALNVLGNDPGSAQLYSLQQDPTGTDQMDPLCEAITAGGAKIRINADGTIDYNATNIASELDQLAEGEFQTDTFYYTVRMANGALSTALVTLEIAGVNDAPTLSSAPIPITVDTPDDDTPAAVTGSLQGSDVDNGAILTYNLNGAVINLAGEMVKQNDYGTLILTTSGDFSFIADPDKIDTIPLGMHVDVIFNVTVTDEHGASTSQDQIFQLIGANDTAVITSLEVIEEPPERSNPSHTGPVVIDHASGSVTEDGTLTVSDKISVSDRDEGQSSFATLLDSDLNGTYGDFTFGTDGTWSYTLRNGDNNVQALGATDHPTDTLRVFSLDGSAFQDIVVTVNGTNDPTTIAGDFTREVMEDVTLSAAGNVSVNDPDGIPGELIFKAINNADELEGDYGNFTFDNVSGDWTYQLSNEASVVQDLAVGISKTDTLMVTSQDGTVDQLITVTVIGTGEPSAGSSDQTPIIIFDVGLSDFDASGKYEIFGFTGNDFLRLADELEFENSVPIDYIPDPDNIRDSVLITSTSWIGFNYFESDLYLVGTPYFTFSMQML